MFYSHFLPPGPVVDHTVAPHIEVVRNVLVRQDSGQIAVRLQADIALTGGQHDALLTDAVQNPSIMHVPHEIRRAVEVAVFVVIAVEELMNIVSTAHTN